MVNAHAGAQSRYGATEFVFEAIPINLSLRQAKRIASQSRGTVERFEIINSMARRLRHAELAGLIGRCLALALAREIKLVRTH